MSVPALALLVSLAPLGAAARTFRAAAPVRGLLPASVPPAPGLVKEYFDAARTGDIPGLLRAVSAGVPVDYQGEHAPFGQTALLAAAGSRQPVAAARLLGMGADGGARDNLGATAPIYAAINKDIATLEAVLASPRADVTSLDARLRSAFDYARESGDQSALARLDAKLSAVDLSAQPEHYLVVNFLGLGGGGRIEDHILKKEPRIAGVRYARRGRTESRAVRALIERWMAFDRSQGGPRWQSLAIVGASWGAGPSRSLARWFRRRYGFPARLHVIVEGANLLGLPYRRIGPAETLKAYHVDGLHWPRGGEIRGAENEALGDTDHDSGLAIGAGRAASDIAALLARGLRR